jgi:flagellar protein FlaG
MVNEVMSEAILLIASITLASLLSVLVISKYGLFESTLGTMVSNERNIILSKIKIFYANFNGSSVVVWFKNVGSVPIIYISKMDVYFGPYGSATYIPYNNTSLPSWTYKIYNGNTWSPGSTILITINLSSALGSGVYYVKLMTYEGASDDYIFSV